MKHITPTVLIYLSIFSWQSSNCQVFQNDLPFVVETKAIVQLVDSEYLLIPELIVKSKNEKIKIHKKIYYTDGGGYDFGDARMYLQKQLRIVAENISLDAIHDRLLLDKNEDSFITFGSANFLRDTINLKVFYPFEIGIYRLRVEIDFYYKNKKHTSTSEFINFNVPYLPKNPFFY